MHTPSTGPRSLLLVAVMALALIAVACAGDRISGTNAGDQATSRPTATDAGDDDGDGMPMHAEEGGGHEEGVDDEVDEGVDGEIVVAGHDDFSFEPEELTLDAGTYRFVYRNEGQIPHQLAIARHGEGHHHVGDTGEIPGGETASFVVTVEPGTYEMMCDVAGHYEAGMHGTIVVE